MADRNRKRESKAIAKHIDAGPESGNDFDATPRVVNVPFAISQSPPAAAVQSETFMDENLNPNAKKGPPASIDQTTLYPTRKAAPQALRKCYSSALVRHTGVRMLGILMLCAF